MVKAGGLQIWVWALLDEKDIGYVSFEFFCSVDSLQDHVILILYFTQGQTQISCTAGRFFTTEPPGKPLCSINKIGRAHV